MPLTIPPMVPLPHKTKQYAPEIYGTEITTYRSTYTERGEGVPQILLVEQPEPGSVLLPHYHASDQYQVFMDGDGLLGRHPLHPVSIHYTNKYTGYGPIVAGEQGVTYYVLRPSFDPLGPGQYLHVPELREKAKGYSGKRRTLTAEVGYQPAEALRGLAAPLVETLFEVGADQPDHGTLAMAVSLGAGRRYTAPDPAQGGGQIIMVLQGEISLGSFHGGPRSAVTLQPDEAAATLTAGPEGAQLLFMQFPVPREGAHAA